MVFSGATFLVYFLPVVLLLYLIIPNSFKNLFLLLSSVAFYSWGAPLFIFVILATTTLDFYLVRMLWEAQTEKKRKLLLVLSLCLNVGLLFYFKYCNFFIDNLNSLLTLFGTSAIKWTKIILPIGISFYTFESLTYVIDVYRKEHKPLSNFLQYQLYILLFPKLIAGPIIRFSQISDQITGRFAWYNTDMIIDGFCRFAIGLGKKVLIANVVGRLADQIFNTPIVLMSASECWLGAIAYTFQIYFDFSGYSDMAIGLGEMFGFKFPENFNNPYTAKSVTDFWRRWHMTLGSWMKNYLYIPLGGNQVSSKTRLYFNLWLVFLLSGFWHGANWTFIIWGIYYGTWLVLERLFLGRILEKLGIFSCIFTFTIVVIGWVFFRAETFSQATDYVARMFTPGMNDGYAEIVTPRLTTVLILSTIFSFFVLLPYGQQIQDIFYSRTEHALSGKYLLTFVCLGLFVLSLAAIGTAGFNPFIYFRF